MLPLTAAGRWALLDYGEGDGPSADRLMFEYRYPEPGELAEEGVTLQLYWPAIGPHDLAYRRTGVRS